MPSYRFAVNGESRSVEVRDPAQPLLYVVRNALGLSGAKFGCGLGQCGACTVLLDGRAVRSCQLPVSAIAGRSVMTIEGLGSPEKPHPVQAAQCGYCANGMVMTSVALLAGNPRPTPDEVKAALAGNLCRYGTHQRILRAVARASGRGRATS